MTIKKRALLIITGVIIFVIVAPLAIFFARGFRFDFSQGEITKTGVLVVKTDPKDARFFFQDDPPKDTPLTKRFIFPGEYSLTIEKEDYKTWKKTVRIHPQLISNPAQTGTEKIYLLLETPIETLLATTTRDSFFGYNSVTYLQNNLQIFTADKTGQSKQLLAEIKNNLTAPQILEVKEKQVLVQDGQDVWNISENDELLLPNALNQIKLGARKGTVLGLTPEQLLMSFDTSNQTQTVLKSGVASFALQGDGLYLLQNDKLIQIENDGPELVLMAGLPDYEDGEIIVSPDRQIFLLLDTTLYQIKENLEKINENVAYAQWEEHSAALVYGNQNEAWLYRPLDENPNELLSRSSAGVGVPVYNSKIGYFFLQIENELKAIETSFDGQQNSYTLIETENQNADFSVGENGEYLIIQDGETLLSLKIR